MSVTDSNVRMRSIYAASMPYASLDSESQSQNGSSAALTVKSNDSEAQATATGTDGEDNDKGYVDESVKLPESTHTLLFTQPACSIPFLFSVGIVILTYGCLILTGYKITGGNFQDPSNRWNLPVNVTWEVRTAQYLAIFIVLLMEEEIPTGIYLLRRIPRAAFEKQYPGQKYSRFILSSAMRICMGYIFLLNAFVVLIRATEVIEIFYDVLALQFVQQLDDIAFSLAKMDALGVAMRKACMSKCFHTEFDRKQFKRNRVMSIVLKAVYFINLGCLLAGMSLVTLHQINGEYQRSSITVDFGSEIWEEALINLPKKQYEKWVWMYPDFKNYFTSDQYEQATLVYSFFNGVYERDPTVMHAGRPVYKERRKFDSTPFEHTVPAEIKYCEGISAWVFTHKHIHKFTEPDETGCNWLLRSEETTEFDLLNVATKWKVWVGVIGQTDVSYSSNECIENIDCNLNGDCVNSRCQCYNRTGVEYLGTHCEVKLEDSCQTLIGESHNETWHITYNPSNGNFDDGPFDTLREQYSRPVYTLPISETEECVLVYVGDRWFGLCYKLGEDFTWEHGIMLMAESHGFWGGTAMTLGFISDKTKKDNPVGVDFYFIGERGDQFGPFGALYPAQLYNQTGRGYYRCGGPLPQLKNAQNSSEVSTP